MEKTKKIQQHKSRIFVSHCIMN